MTILVVTASAEPDPNAGSSRRRWDSLRRAVNGKGKKEGNHNRANKTAPVDGPKPDPRTDPSPPTPPLYMPDDGVCRRAATDRLIGGVCGGVARHLGVSSALVRVVVILLSLLSGPGVFIYPLAWLFIPLSPLPYEGEKSPRSQVPSLVAIGIGAALITGTLSLGMPPELGIPLIVALAGVSLVWTQADRSQRYRWRNAALGGASPWRLALGLILVGVGVALFFVLKGQVAVAGATLAATLVLMAGISIVAAPLLRRLASDLGEERRARIRSEERAEVAAHLHDSVLQTLAIIQKNADDPLEVRRLARSQERDLRAWLYDPSRAAAPERPTSLKAALTTAAAEIEDDHRVEVEVVCVGDTEGFDDRVEALARASREAMVNAAKHSQARTIDVYAEVEEGTACVFIRDRGKGFDVEAEERKRQRASAEAARHGLFESIIGRMERHGGTAKVRSNPGEGTEIRLEMPL